MAGLIEYHLGVSTTPSYTLLRIISSVCRKCFLLASIGVESCWVPAKLEWISSINPLRYFVVTCRRKLDISKVAQIVSTSNR